MGFHGYFWTPTPEPQQKYTSVDAGITARSVEIHHFVYIPCESPCFCICISVYFRFQLQIRLQEGQDRQFPEEENSRWLFTFGSVLTKVRPSSTYIGSETYIARCYLYLSAFMRTSHWLNKTPILRVSDTLRHRLFGFCSICMVVALL